MKAAVALPTPGTALGLYSLVALTGALTANRLGIAKIDPRFGPAFKVAG